MHGSGKYGDFQGGPTELPAARRMAFDRPGYRPLLCGYDERRPDMKTQQAETDFSPIEIIADRKAIPPFASLRAFEAVGRLSGIRKAAAELANSSSLANAPGIGDHSHSMIH